MQQFFWDVWPFLVFFDGVFIIVYCWSLGITPSKVMDTIVKSIRCIFFSD